MDKYCVIQTIWVLIIMLVITATQTVRATETETTNILSNGTFDGNTNGWTLDGTATYDGNHYSGSDLNKTVRFSGASGGSVTQSIDLSNLSDESKNVVKIEGSITSYGCNNEGSSWCTKTGTANNLDPVNATITFTDGTQTEVLSYNYTSDYNDGVITTDYEINLDKEFDISITSLSYNVAGADTGDWSGKFGTIIDNLSLVLTLSDVVVAEAIEEAEITPINASDSIIQQVIEPDVVETVQIGSLDATSIANTISTGVIDINPPEDMQIASLSSSISVISDIRAEEMHSDMADVGLNNEMPTLVNTGAEVPVETGIPENELPDIDVDIEIESMNEPEPETLQEIREETPAEVEEINMEEDLKENENEQQEETPAENDENAGENEEGDLSDDTTAEEKSDEKEESSEKEVKEKPTKNEEKTVKTTKTVKSEKKEGSESENKGDKKSSATKTTSEIKSDIVIQELDLPTIISFNKEYFANTYKDTIDLTTTEMDFYDGQDGFSSQDYTQANSAFFNQYSDTNSEWDLVAKPSIIKIDSFRR
jgi:hypothetical protein